LNQSLQKRTKIKMEKIYFTFLESPIGPIKIVGDETHITEVVFVEEAGNPSKNIPNHLNNCKEQLSAYFQNKLKVFDLPLNPAGTDFQKQVWQKLLQIHYGKSQSYKAIAQQLGDVKKIRAAASANGKNPIAIIIPCHRVIGSNGSLTGYAGGLERKEWLLKHEGVIKQNNEQLSLF